MSKYHSPVNLVIRIGTFGYLLVMLRSTTCGVNIPMPAKVAFLEGLPTGIATACRAFESCESGEGKRSVVEKPVTDSVFTNKISLANPTADDKSAGCITPPPSWRLPGCRRDAGVTTTGPISVRARRDNNLVALPGLRFPALIASPL